MSSEKPPVTQQPPPYGGYAQQGYGQQGYAQGYDNMQMQPAYNPQQVGQVAHPGETVIVQPMGVSQFQGQVPAGCPPGMEYLASLDKVSIFQVVHLSEVLTGCERNNEYRVCNVSDQEFLHAKEDTDCMTRQCLGNIRPFHIDLNTMNGATVMQLERPLRCQGCLCCCCLQEMEVFCPPGNKIATVKEKWSMCVPRYEVFDATGQLVFKVEGECCYCKCCTDIPFKVFRADGSEGGEITKHWRGCEEMCAHVNNFSCTYMPGETPLNKAILLGTTFLVDYMYFEYNGNNQ